MFLTTGSSHLKCWLQNFRRDLMAAVPQSRASLRVHFTSREGLFLESGQRWRM